MNSSDAALQAPLGTAAGIDGESKNGKIAKFDLCFSYFAFIIYSDAMADPIRVLRGLGHPPPGESDPVLWFSETFILVTLTCIVLARSHRLFPLLRFIKPYLLLVALCLISSLWSEFPGLTLRRAITFGACLMFGVYCYEVFGLARTIGMITRLATVLAVLSVILFIAVPAIGIDPTIGSYNAMRGVFPAKNALALFMVLAIICRAYSILVNHDRIAFVGSAPLLYLSIVLSQSASSLIAATVVLAVTGVFYLPERSGFRMLYWYVVGSVCAIAIAVAILAPGAIFDTLGRDASLTGRTPVWEESITAIAQKPFLGYGYAAFWDANSRLTRYIWLRVGWEPEHAHDGYIETTLEIGLVGLSLILWMWGRTILLALKARRSGTLPSASWILLLVFLIALINWDENQLSSTNLPTVLMPVAMIEIAKWNDKRQRAALAARWTGRPPASAEGRLALSSYFLVTRLGVSEPRLIGRGLKTRSEGRDDGR